MHSSFPVGTGSHTNQCVDEKKKEREEMCEHWSVLVAYLALPYTHVLTPAQQEEGQGYGEREYMRQAVRLSFRAIFTACVLRSLLFLLVSVTSGFRLSLKVN